MEGHFRMGRSKEMRGKAAAWAVFLLCLLLLSLAATPYSSAADHALMAVRFTIVIVLSVLVVRQRWRHRHDLEGQEPQSRPDSAEGFLQRCRRWYYDEPKR